MRKPANHIIDVFENKHDATYASVFGGVAELYRALRILSSRTTMEPLRLNTLTSGPPPAMEPVTFRLDTEPWTDALMTLTDPDPLLTSSVTGTEDSVAMSILPDPADAFQSRRGTP